MASVSENVTGVAGTVSGEDVVETGEDFLVWGLMERARRMKKARLTRRYLAFINYNTYPPSE